MKYIYPAIFEYTDNIYMVRFPDLRGCVTSGKDIEDAVDMAKDALSCYLCTQEDLNTDIPEPSKPNDIDINKGAFVTLIEADTQLYRAEIDNRVIRKTVSIPEWMNIKAEREGISLSQTLQDALRVKFE